MIFDYVNRQPFSSVAIEYLHEIFLYLFLFFLGVALYWDHYLIILQCTVFGPFMILSAAAALLLLFPLLLLVLLLLLQWAAYSCSFCCGLR